MNRHGGIRREGVIDYSVNINPLGMPEWVKDKVLRILDEAHTYPEILAEEAVESLASHLKELPQRILLGNGATELLYLLARTLVPGRVAIIEPTFNEYRRAFQASGWKILPFLRERDSCEIDIQKLLDWLKKESPDLVVVCEPNNPTSTMLGKEKVELLISRCREMGVILLLDESFLDFVEQELPSHSQGVIRLRSMTKFYAIAGIRLGYILADEFLIKKMIKQKEPWSVNAFAQGIVPKLLADHAFKDDTYKLIREQRELLLRGLQSLGLRGPLPHANFLFFRCEEDGFHTKMLEKGFYLRSCEDFYSLDSHDFRMCVRTEKENRALLQAMKEVLT
ncbi:MAG: pyridoxal phosphate-dependent class II aminotransferase [Tissierellia bacterium]|nr:pyridoxal phosphate-dependent class II aminotransferase [Bacillota bacterium]NLL22176.1 pyridoxal phosphate-dependent class II aminotransferase [Tissierellia bacterium]